MKRIARGIQRFVIDNPTPFIVKCNHTTSKGGYDCFRGQSLDDPLQTITRKHGYAVVAPIFAGTGGSTFQMKPRPVDKPFFTLLTQNRTNVVCPMLAPVISRQFGNSVGHPVDEPAGTVTAGGGGHSALVVPTMIQMGYGERPGQAPRVLDIDKPVGTVTAGGNKFALATAFLAKHFGGNYTGPGAALDGPAHTVTTTDHHALVTSNLIKFRGTNTGQPTDTPLHTITASGTHLGEVRAFLMKYYGNEKGGVGLTEPLGTVTTSDRFGLVTVDGTDYQIVDIGMRMLQPHELYAAQGFPSWYVIDQDFRGTKYAKDKQVARCGNAVPPPFAEALVRANLPEMCSPLAREKIA